MEVIGRIDKEGGPQVLYLLKGDFELVFAATYGNEKRYNWCVYLHIIEPGTPFRRLEFRRRHVPHLGIITFDICNKCYKAITGKDAVEVLYQ